jgi:hypothetical protein
MATFFRNIQRKIADAESSIRRATTRARNDVEQQFRNLKTKINTAQGTTSQDPAVSGESILDTRMSSATPRPKPLKLPRSASAMPRYEIFERNLNSDVLM